ncbi:hypothetical protein [Aequorivita echinoideorum]|uniref:SpoIIAA-like n=1 Tax=Aequorivita echinoideorum TaxID=1549647 RepID=A0ABS5S6A1_9FLAO|nr:hypothetical protein [Aequorivita echinoideorum]MBT0608728.1 hypothetical protein [Aequorivita echinoideorum]
MIKALFYEFGELNVFKNFVIAIMNEGTTVLPKHNDVLRDIADRYFENRPFGYITYRKNSYSVDPLVYIQTSQIENLIGFAVVSKEESKLANLEIEKYFLKKPLASFSSLDDAKDWINSLIESQKG